LFINYFECVDAVIEKKSHIFFSLLMVHTPKIEALSSVLPGTKMDGCEIHLYMDTFLVSFSN
jgi:hypothetical protein